MKKVLIASLFVLSFVFLAWIPRTAGVSTTLENGTVLKASFSLGEDGAIVWNTTTHDFGSITQNEPVEYEFEITNNGAEAVKILDVKTSCGCTAAGYSKEPIEPGNSTNLTASYNAKKAGIFSKDIKVYTDAQEEPFLLKIRGEVEAAK